MKIVIKIYKNVKFVSKSKDMPLESDYDDIYSDVESLIDHITKGFNEENSFRNDSLNKVFSRYGHLFSVESEISVHKGYLTVRTFHLVRDVEIFDCYKKTPVSRIEISGTIDKNGQIMYGYSGSAKTFIPTTFIKTEVEKYKKGLETFIESLP